MTTSTRRRLLGFTLGGAVTAVASLPPSPVDAQPAGFDHSHTAWTALLRKHGDAPFWRSVKAEAIPLLQGCRFP